MWRIFLLLFVILGMIALTSSLLINNYNLSQQLANKTTHDIENKLDLINNETQKQLNQQGNISSEQRHKIIEGLEHLPEGGIASHQDAMTNQHIMKEILGNLTMRK